MGYTPSEIPRSLPSYRYLRRHQRLPLGLTSIYKPPPSKSFVGLSIAFAERISSSVKVISELPPSMGEQRKSSPLDSPTCVLRLSMDGGELRWNRNPLFYGIFRSPETSLDFLGSVSGAGGGNRTHTLLPEPDFESGASTSSATPACSYINHLES